MRIRLYYIPLIVLVIISCWVVSGYCENSTPCKHYTHAVEVKQYSFDGLVMPTTIYTNHIVLKLNYVIVRAINGNDYRIPYSNIMAVITYAQPICK